MARSRSSLPLVAGICLVAALMAGAYLGLSHLLPRLMPDVEASADAGPGDLTYTEWDAGSCPDYYRMAGPACFSQDELQLARGEVTYAGLDKLGRAGRVAGRIDLATMEAGLARERGNLQGSDPSGWGFNEEADIDLGNGESYHGYFWNRSHLLAKSLGGSDELENLVCGTRMQNVGTNDGSGGMGYAESLARAWLYDHPDASLLYAATPVYEGDEPVCRSVFVDVLSDDGSLDERIEVYNAARGYRIDYQTGRFWAE